MSSSESKKLPSLHIDLSRNRQESAPPLAALFLITFDVKAGYTIAWQHSLPGLELEQSVEYRSLPSGLHNIHEDLIYFTHSDEYVGISAFYNKPSQDAERNSVMIAVGVLLPSHGQLGRAWLHAEALKGLARHASSDVKNTAPLEAYWKSHELEASDPVERSANGSPSTSKRQTSQSHSASDGRIKTRNRAVSTASALGRPGQFLSPDHPVQSLHSFLDTFGPLIFPIYKLALLRRRLLFTTSAPVHPACNFVYDTSLISGIPSSVSEDIPLEPLPSRLSPLFSVGLHDIDLLSQGSRTRGQSDDEGYGWVACTTDEIIRQKRDLFDFSVSLPPAHSKNADRKVWPEIFDSGGIEVKATQRDLRRYRVLKREIQRFQSSSTPKYADDSMQPLASLVQDSAEADTSSTYDADLAEKKSLMAVVYEGFMWWAAAGEKRTDLDEEEQHDAALMRSIDDDSTPGRPRSSGRSPGGMQIAEDHMPAAFEVNVVAFFHHLTTQIFRTLALVIQDADEASHEQEAAETNESDAGSSAAVSTDSAPLIPAEDAEKRAPVVIEADDMARMGLDLWSESDRSFVEGLIALYWGRKARVAQTPAIECCGVRIC